MRIKRGQSILEYVLVLAAIIAGIMVAKNVFQSGVGTALTNAGNSIANIDLGGGTGNSTGGNETGG